MLLLPLMQWKSVDSFEYSKSECFLENWNFGVVNQFQLELYPWLEKISVELISLEVISENGASYWMIEEILAVSEIYTRLPLDSLNYLQVRALGRFW